MVITTSYVQSFFFFLFKWNLFIVFFCCSEFTNLFACKSIEFLFSFRFNQFKCYSTLNWLYIRFVYIRLFTLAYYCSRLMRIKSFHVKMSKCTVEAASIPLLLWFFDEYTKLKIFDSFFLFTLVLIRFFSYY